MFLLSYIPDIIIHLLLIAGVLGLVAGFFLKSIPLIDTYAREIQLAAIIITVIAVWFEGGIANEDIWQKRVVEAEKKVLIAEAESAKANTQLIEKIKDNEKLRKERQNATQNIITQVVKQNDSQCTLSNGFIRVHNSASQDKVPDSTGQSDAAASNVKPSELLTTVIDNYSTCYDIREKLIGWQEWYKTQKKIYEE